MRIGNWYLLERVLIHIIKHPENYDQTNWSCGTTRCVAGWIVDFAGYQFVTSGSVVPNYVSLAEVTEDGYVPSYIWDLSSDVETVALRLLNLDPERDPDEIADALFSGTLSWAQVLEGVWHLAQGDEHFLDETIMDELRKVGVIAPVEVAKWSTCC